MIWNKIILFLRLGRIHSSVLTGLAPVCVAASTGVSLSLYHYLELFLIGFLFHIYLFVFNEIQDIEVDKASNKLAGKPLVEGSITAKTARIVVFSSVALIIILTVVFFFDKAVILILVSLAAFLLGGLYDSLGKKIPHADYFIALMLFFIALYGGFSVTTNLGYLSYVIALLALVQMLINNIIAGLKDVDHDFIAGGLSTPLRLGVRVEGERFIVSKTFVVYIAILKVLHISLVILPFIMNLITYEKWQFSMVILLIFVSVVFMLRFLTIKTFFREKIMRAIGFHEMFAFMVIPFILISFIGYIGAFFLVVFPILWLGVFLIIMYGRLMPEI